MRLNNILVTEKDQVKSHLTNDLLFEASKTDLHKEKELQEGILDRFTGTVDFDYTEEDFKNLGYLQRALDNNDLGYLIGKPGTVVFDEKDINEIRTAIVKIFENNNLIGGDKLDNYSTFPQQLYSVFNLAATTILSGVVGLVSYWMYQLGLAAVTIGEVLRESIAGALGPAPSVLSTIAGYGLVGGAVIGGLLSALYAVGAYRQARVLKRLHAASKAITASQILSQDMITATREELERTEREYYEHLLEFRPEEAEQWFQSRLEQKAKEVSARFERMFDNLSETIKYRDKRTGEIKEYRTEDLFKRK